MLFDLSITKILVLAVIAVVIFGPDQLPRIAAQAGRMVRELRRLADGARSDLRAGLGPEFADFDIADLNPRHLVRKHLLDDFEDTDTQAPPTANGAGVSGVQSTGLQPGEHPPFDAEAT